MFDETNTKSLTKKRFRVRFRILIDPSKKSNNARKVMTSYRDKFSVFMSSASSVRLTKEDYDELPLFHQLLGNDTQLTSIIPAVLNCGKSSELMSIAPVFDISPMELKAFILLTCGIRASSVRECLEQSKSDFEGCAI